MNKPDEQHGRGFTLVELVVVTAVLAILATIAMPSFTSLIRRNQVTSQANSLLADIQYARSEALAQRSFVSLCPRAANAGAGDEACAEDNSANFDGGWLVYGATAVHAAYDDSDKTHPVLRLTASPGKVSLRRNVAGILTFNARGELAGEQGETVIAVCFKPEADQVEAGSNAPAVPGKLVRIASSGRASVSTLAAGDTCG